MKASKLILYHGVKIDENNVTNLTPTNLLTELLTYKVDEFEDLNLVLENFTLRVPSEYYSIYDCNYMAFQNYGYSNKWFFAFIHKVDYISDSVCEINFAIDYWSTFYSDLTFLKCFVEREITASDTIGENTLDEGLDVGRVSSMLTTEDDFGTGSSCYIAIMSDWNPKNNSTWWDKIIDSKSFSGITVHNNLVSGHQIFLIEIRTGHEELDYMSVLLFILATNKDGRIEDLHDIFILPAGAVDKNSLIPNGFTVEIGETEYACLNYKIPFSFSPNEANWNVAKITSYSDYTPLNNKCFCYPYNYLLVSNNVGNQNIYKYEDFSDSTNAEFQKQFAICIGGSGRIVPKNYKGIGMNYDESLPLAKFPVCGWTADSFTNWLTQNAINITSRIVEIGSGIGFGLSIPDIDEKTGKEIDVVGSQAKVATGLANKVGDLIGQFRQAALMPNIEGGGKNNGDVNYSGGNNSFMFYRMRCKLENLRIIDDYFTKFGYKINRVKVPNLTTSRFNHFYVKIGNGEKVITGNVPKEGIREIENQLYNGLTVWKSIANIGNYESGTVAS